MLAPRLEICSATAAVAPLPSVTIVTTAATPMTMPSVVRNERSRCRLISRMARMMVVKNIRPAPLPCSTRLDQAVAEMDDGAGIGGHVGLVGDHQDGDAEVAVEVGQQVHDLERGLAVEIAGRLVGEQHVGVGDDRAGDGDALLLAAGKLGRRMVPPVPEADLVERRHRRLAPLRLVLAAIEQGQLDIFERVGAGEQVEALEDEAEIAAPEQGALVAVEASRPARP